MGAKCPVETGATTPEETESCIRCHSPQAYLSGRADAIDPAELMPVDFDGVSCDLCHRLENNTVDGTHVVGNAQYRINDLAKERDVHSMSNAPTASGKTVSIQKRAKISKAVRTATCPR